MGKKRFYGHEIMIMKKEGKINEFNDEIV